MTRVNRKRWSLVLLVLLLLVTEIPDDVLVSHAVGILHKLPHMPVAYRSRLQLGTTVAARLRIGAVQFILQSEKTLLHSTLRSRLGCI